MPKMGSRHPSAARLDRTQPHISAQPIDIAMDWKLIASTFGIVFLAELGDKTQLATFTLAAESKSRWAVFLGSSLALLAASAMAVLLGAEIGRVIPEIWLKRAAGVAFILMGLLFLLRNGSPSGG